MTQPPLLSLMVLVPWAGAAALAASHRIGSRAARILALAFSLSTALLAAIAWGLFDPSNPGPQLIERHIWIRTLDVRYTLGIDGLGMVTVLLTAIIAPTCMLASPPAGADRRLYGALFLALQGSALGVFLALDFFPWFLFWELSLVPAYFLIKLWGGLGAGRASLKFFVYTMGGSAFMLAGFAAIRAVAGTLDFAELSSLGGSGELASRLSSIGPWVPRAVFVGVMLGLAVKAPLFPFHTWLPATYAEAPAPVSMFLTAVMSKMGVYGFFRFMPLFPREVRWGIGAMVAMALAGTVLGALAAMRQRDLKRMVAYSSVAHVGVCLLGLFAAAATLASPAAFPAPAISAALSGALFQIFNHGLSAAALFFCVGILESRAAGRRGIDDFGGVRTAAPVFAGLCGIALFSSLGLPGLNGFVGEFLILKGVFGIFPWIGAAVCVGLLATAIFLLTFWQKVFHGPTVASTASFPDLGGREIAVLAPSLLLMFLLGVAPGLLGALFNPLVAAWTSNLISR